MGITRNVIGRTVPAISFVRRMVILLCVMLMTAATAWAGNPVVNVEVCEGGEGYIHVKGWAYDPDNQDYSLDVKVYVCRTEDYIYDADNDIYVFPANKERTGVSGLQGIPGNHGFEFNIPLDEEIYWLRFWVYDRNNINETIVRKEAVNVAAPKTGTVTLTPNTGIVTLGDGATLTGQGGENTRVAIASNATVTLDDVAIRNIPDDDNHMWAGITCLGNATIVLAEGTNNNVMGGDAGYPGIKVGPIGTTLTIRGSGSLVVQSNKTFSAGIGSILWNGKQTSRCGNIVIESGNIRARGGVAPGIGASQNSRCGSITIKGGTIHAEGEDSPGIGCYNSTCDNISITGGTVTANSKRSPAIGSGYKGSCGDITIYPISSVTAESTQANYCIGADDKGTCGTITVANVKMGNITENPYVYAPTDIPYTVTFNANGGAGSMSNQSFYSNTPQALTTNVFTRTGNTFLGWNTQADGTGISYSDGETVNNLGDVTLYAQWIPNTYYVTFDANGGSDTMEPQAIGANVSQDLKACEFTRDYYDFIGWNTQADGTGRRYNDKQTVKNLGDRTLYAQWKPTTYTITYIDAVNGVDEVTNTNPITYTVESADIKLTDPVNPNAIFDGWTYKDITTPTKSVIIAHGSYGDKTFTAHWTTNSTVTLTEQSGSLKINHNTTITGTGGTNTHITIKDGITVVLHDLNITNIRDNNYWAGITCEGDATIILEGTNAVKGGACQYPGIYVPEGKTLTILGSGSLSASSNGAAPGIGALYAYNCGNIVIAGGTITATGGNRSAGIGGHEYGSCGNITITDGVTSVTAKRGENCPNAIGTGHRSHCGTVTIGGIETGDIALATYTYKPAETIYCTVTFDANGGTGEMANQRIASNIPQPLSACTFTCEGCYFEGWNTKADGSGISYEDVQDSRPVASATSVTLYAQWRPLSVPITITSETGYRVINDGQILTGTGGTNTHIVIADGATVTLRDVNITNITNDDDHKWAGISCEGDAIILLEGENSVKGGQRCWPGIHIPSYKTLIIRGDGILNASGNGQSSGIGGGNFVDERINCGNIIIEGGIINAVAAGSGTGIGGGNSGTCGDITITGGTITATGAGGGAGIGGVQHCGNITITDGVTSVTAIKSNRATCHIGADNCGNITIAPGLNDVIEGSTRTLIPKIDYVDANGTVQMLYKSDFIELTNETDISTFPTAGAEERWLVVKGADVGFDQGLEIYGTTNLVLADGASLTFFSNSSNAIYHEGTLNIYGGPLGTGRLNVVTNAGRTALSVRPLIGANRIPGYLNIYGGQITANTDGGTGIQASTGTTLSWTREANSITTDSFGGVVTIASGKAFTDGTDIFSGMLSIDDKSAIANKTLTPLTAVSLVNNASNADVITELDGISDLDVTLSGRTLYRDGFWNTLCLPFDIDDISSTPLEGAVIKELDGTTSNLTDDILTLNFTDASSLEAGKPYIVKWDLEKRNMSEPFFDLSDSEIAALGFISEVPTYDDGQESNWGTNQNEGAEKLVDGKLNTKYGLSNANPWVEFHYADAITPKGYAIWTADDTEGARNPKSWTIKAKNSGDTDWTTLVTVDNNSNDKLPMENNKRTVFALNNKSSWQYFRFEATKGSEFQLAELQFCTTLPGSSEPEIINTDAEWETFAAKVNNGLKTYQGTKVKLSADINVSAMVGTNEHPFRGTFDGNGHTMKLSISDESNQGTAPFRYISGATIVNVKTEGTVTGNLHCAGLVGFAKDGTNSIKNCVVATDIVCSGGNHSHCGGILGHGKTSNTTISDCLFTGSITGATIATGIIYGWGDSGTHSIENCLSAGTYTNCNGIELLRKDEGTESITNCYRKTSGGSQGTDASSMTASELADALGSKWQVKGENVVPKKYDSSLSPVVNPVFEKVTIDASASTSVAFDGGSFIGSYSPVALPVNDTSNLFLGTNNTLYWPNGANNEDGNYYLNACRAYFHVDDVAAVREFVLNFDEGETTGIESMHNSECIKHNKADAWYSLDGRKLDGKPSAKGLYIYKDRKVVIK